MAIILFFSAFVFMYGVVSIYYKPINTLYPNMEKLICNVILFSTTIVLFTEFLSLIKQVNYIGIIIGWCIINAILLIVFFVNHKQIKLQYTLLFKELYEAFFRYKKNIFNHFIWYSSVLILLSLFFLCFIYPPNSIDGLTYHLPRIYHWVTNNSLDIYPTSIYRQIFNPPFSSILYLHINILSKNDVFVNSIQFCFALCTIILFYLILIKLVSKKYTKIGLILLICLPIFISSSISIYNDIIVAFYIVTFLYFGVLKIFENKENINYTNVIFIALSIALALYTKATAYVFLIPLIIVCLIIFIKKNNFIRNVYSFFLVILCVLLLNSGYYLRNYSLNQNILAQEKITTNNELKYTCETKDIRLLYPNLFKNLGNQINYPLNQYYNKLLRYFNIDLNNKKVSLDNYYEFEKTYKDPFLDGTIPNFLHILIFIFVILFSLFKLKKIYIKDNQNPVNNKFLLIFILILLLNMLLYSFIINYNFYSTRPLIILFYFMIFILVLLLDKFKLVESNFNVLIYKLIILSAFIYIFALISFNRAKPFIKTKYFKSENSIFSNRIKKIFTGSYNKPVYSDLENTLTNTNIKNIKNISFICSEDFYEYAIIYPFQFSKNYFHINIQDNPTKKISNKINQFDAIISNTINKDTINYNYIVYKNITPQNSTFWYYKKQ